MIHVSAGQWVLLIGLSLLWGFLGYRLSEQARRVTGRTPWGLPSQLWALFWFLSLALGLLLYVIYLCTRAIEQRRTAQGLPGPAGPTPAPGPAAMRGGSDANAGSNFPAYPRPANSGPTAPSADLSHLPAPPRSPKARPGEGAASAGAPSADAPSPSVASDDVRPAEGGPDRQPTVSPPAWHPDPGGRFHYRWWNGSEWTSQVAIDGQHLIDTSPDQRIGPY